MQGDEVLRVKSRYNPWAVHRRGDTVVRDSSPWTPAVHSLLRHLEDAGFEGAPRLVGVGFDSEGRETLTYIEGEVTDQGSWTLEGAAAVGGLLRELHKATATYRPDPGATWFPWFGRDMGNPRKIIGHCDAAMWNVVAREGMPIALIDWERAGPVDPLVDLAQACWNNANLYDDVVADSEGLPPLSERARQLRAMVDAYGLGSRERRGFLDTTVEIAVHATAEEADEAGVTPETVSAETDDSVVWRLSWRARSVSWMLRHRQALENALA